MNTRSKKGKLNQDVNDTGFIPVSKNIIHLVGLNAATIYAEFCNKKRYFQERGTLTEDKYFFCSASDLQESTGLSRSQQNKGFSILTEHKLLEKATAKNTRYFLLFDDENSIKTAIDKGKEIREKLKESNKLKVSDYFNRDERS